MSSAHVDLIERYMRECTPRVLPAGWRITEKRFINTIVAWKGNPPILSVISEVAVYGEHTDELWLHTSVSGRNRLPTWEELREVKVLFVGAHRDAIQCFPRVDEYVNHDPHVLHLWSRLLQHSAEGWAASPRIYPDFRKLDPGTGKLLI